MREERKDWRHKTPKKKKKKKKKKENPKSEHENIVSDVHIYVQMLPQVKQNART
jgi:hypothetical protein